MLVPTRPPLKMTSGSTNLCSVPTTAPPPPPTQTHHSPYSHVLDVHSMSGCEPTSVIPPVDTGGGASEIHRLQELLHQALRREAEALKKLKHLNETITSCERDRPTCGSISSASDGTYPSSLLRCDPRTVGPLYCCTLLCAQVPTSVWTLRWRTGTEKRAR